MGGVSFEVHEKRIGDLKADVARTHRTVSALMDEGVALKREIERLTAENEKLRLWAEDEQRKRHKAEEDRMNERSEVARLLAALADTLSEVVEVRKNIIEASALDPNRGNRKYDEAYQKETARLDAMIYRARAALEQSVPKAEG